MKDKKLILYIIAILILVLVVIGCIYLFMKNKNTKKELKTETDNYVAYVKINPSIKLEYSQTCKYFSDDTKECTEPEVNNYVLVNDDAKEIFKDVNLLQEDKDLASVIELICDKVKEKGISTQNVEIQSDWSELNSYLEEEQEKTETSSSTTNYNYTVDIEEKDTITNTITEDVKVEEQEKAEVAEKARLEAEAKAKAEAEAKAKAEAEAKAKASNTIKLSDNVTYGFSEIRYTCEGCITESLINSLKNAKGHALMKSDENFITIRRITSLSGNYNSTKYYGDSKLNLITNAGAEEAGGLGSSNEPLTKEICNQFHLICE